MRALSILVLTVLATPAAAHPGLTGHIHPQEEYLAGLAPIGVCLAVSLLAAANKRRSEMRPARSRAKR